MQEELRQLVLNKDAAGSRSFLENLPPTEKGPAFEQFLEELYNGNGYKAVRQGGKGDGGADILLYEPNEEQVFCIIQAKNESKPLTLDKTVSELNKFETKASSKYGCNEFEVISMNGFVKDAKELRRFRINLRDWDYIEGLIESYDPDSKSVPHIRLHAHNQTAFEAVMEGFADGQKVACVQATGTGKSYVIGAVMNQFADEQKLLLAPSKYIINQQSQVARWLNASTEYKTYQSLPHLENEEIKALNPSLIVLDEFHRAGAEKWGDGVEKVLEAFPDAKVLGTTATPIRYLDSQRDMSDELFDMEAVNLPLAEAILRKILPSPNYVSALYTLREEADALLQDLEKSQKSDTEKKTIKSEIDRAVIDWEKTSGVAEILKKHLGDRKCKKFVVFCKDIEHLNELEDEVRKWFRKTGLFEDRESYRVYSGYKKSDANYKRFLAADDDSTAHILLAVDMLNEGIHASDINAVLLFRPTTSPRIFYQQIGRCLQVGSKNNPIIFDFVNNFQSIRANDFLGDLEEASEKEREIRSRFGLDVDHLPELQVHDESKDVLKIFEEIENRLGTWEIRFEELVAYKHEHGDCLVPQRHKAIQQLGYWVNSQRKLRKNGTLSEDKVGRLDELGFAWEPFDTQWESMFQELVAFKKEHGISVKGYTRYEENRKLASWVRTQRRSRKNGTLSEDKVGRLDSIGLPWDTIAAQWESMFQELVAYKEEHGDCFVPQGHKAIQQLASWVMTQRLSKKRETLSQHKAERLDELGFVWEPFDTQWESMFQELVAYKKEHGDCIVLQGDEENRKLSTWVRSQRRSRNEGTLSKDKVDRLEAICFVWDMKKAQWESMVQELVAYKEEHGDCLVSMLDEENKQLATWVSTQRQSRKKGTLSQYKVGRLDSIGFVWDMLEAQWESMYQELVAYKEEYGDCIVPKGYKAIRQLASWVNTQRLSKKKETLSQDQVARLDSIGFVWDLGKYE